MRKFVTKGKDKLLHRINELYNRVFNQIGMLMNCLFCNIVKGEIPATVVFEDKDIIAIRDINPQAPTHILLIPKKHIATVNDAGMQDKELLGAMVLGAKKLAAVERLSEDGYRLVFNINSGGGQEVYHIHLHLMGGRQMTWPPG